MKCSVFNCGIGYAVILSEENAKLAKEINLDLIEIGFISDEETIFKYI